MDLRHYIVKDGYIVGTGDKSDDTISLPEGYVNEELIKENAYEVDANGMVNLSEKYLSKRNLNNTDWKMIRHRDQLAQGIDTSLSDEQYQELLIKRQNWREKASD
tara:strand:- start:2271 stop:2585 length:315 start_codon:yes stop_codon:yes gene_type:complete